jgi:UDP-glucose 6-dehydrogenase
MNRPIARHSHAHTRNTMHSNMNTSPAGSVSRVGKATRTHKVVVIKVGTSSLLRKGHLHLSMLGALAEACSDLSRAGCKVIVVTSGAVGAGCQVLGAVSDDLNSLEVKQFSPQVAL